MAGLKADKECEQGGGKKIQTIVGTSFMDVPKGGESGRRGGGGGGGALSPRDRPRTPRVGRARSDVASHFSDLFFFEKERMSGERTRGGEICR